MSKNTEGFNLTNRLHSVKTALHGLALLVKNEHNSWVHLAATLAVIALGVYCDITTTQWCFLVLAITLVWMAEAFNTAIEYLCDKVSPEYHELIKHTKDVAAAAVLLTATGAVVIGALVFYPYLP